MPIPRRSVRHVAAGLLIAAGVCTLTYTAVGAPLSQRVWITGLRSDLGVVDGDRPAESSIRLFNPHRSPVSVEVVAPGCGCDGRSLQKVHLPPLSGRSVPVFTDPTARPEGTVRDKLVVLGYLEGRPFRIERAVTYVVRRDPDPPRP